MSEGAKRAAAPTPVLSGWDDLRQGEGSSALILVLALLLLLFSGVSVFGLCLLGMGELWLFQSFSHFGMTTGPQNCGGKKHVVLNSGCTGGYEEGAVIAGIPSLMAAAEEWGKSLQLRIASLDLQQAPKLLWVASPDTSMHPTLVEALL